MKVERIDHVAILVNDTRKAQEFFADLFGTKFNVLGDIKEMDIKSVLDPLGIELVEPLLPDGVTAKALKERGEGLTLLSLKVTDLDEAMTEMKARNIRLIQHAKLRHCRVAVYHPNDLFGVMIELIAYEQEHPTAIAITQER